jgi:hypothetical protein
VDIGNIDLYDWSDKEVIWVIWVICVWEKSYIYDSYDAGIYSCKGTCTTMLRGNTKTLHAYDMSLKSVILIQISVA